LTCTNGVCGSSCTADTATDLGGLGNAVTVPRDGCVKVHTGFPAWWDTRQMKLEPTDIANYSEQYPVPFTWSSTCSNNTGSGQFTANYTAVVIGNISETCAVVIDLLGAAGSNVQIRYYNVN
jgi:hypothetical protein